MFDVPLSDRGIQRNLSLIKRIRLTLFTKEDRFAIHKLLGLICLLGFFFATIRAFQFNHAFKPFFTHLSFVVVILLLSHVALAMSSLMFHVPVKRYFSYIGTLEHQEQRLHSMIFSLRSVSFVLWYMTMESLLLKFFPFFQSFLWVFRAFLLSIWHILADMVTHRYAGVNGSTIRGSHNVKSTLYRLGTSFSSISQLGAILILLGFSATTPLQYAYLPDLCYITLLPIQLVVFQLTLKRKGFLSDKLNGVYIFQLVIVVVALSPNSRELFLLALFGIFRFLLNFNKYALFLAFAFLAQHFTFTVEPWIPVLLGMVLLFFMMYKSKVQCFLIFASVKCQVLKKIELQKHTFYFELKLPEGFAFRLSPGRNLALEIGEKNQRFYTLITSSQDEKRFFILAKTYPEGKAYKLLATVNVGDELEFSGPYGDIFYAKNRALRHGDIVTSLKNKRLLCIAGGTGITPIYSILSNINAKVSVELVYINRTKHEIFLKEQLQMLPKNIKVIYHLTREEDHDPFFIKGRYIPEQIDAEMVLVSGPAQFCNFLPGTRRKA